LHFAVVAAVLLEQVEAVLELAKEWHGPALGDLAGLWEWVVRQGPEGQQGQ
jgi:hypothetical protein